jgi:hypothetical protein
LLFPRFVHVSPKLIFGHFASSTDREGLKLTAGNQRFDEPDIDIPILGNLRVRIVIRQARKIGLI